ncbi:hypothetical protein Hanom_Chr03g00193961 [Helianthus anomalus]
MPRRRSISSSSRSWASASIKEAFSSTLVENRREDGEEELKWTAIEMLSTYDRLKKGIMKYVLDNGHIVHEEIDVTLPGPLNKVGIDIPLIKIRYKTFLTKGHVHVGSRALPTLLNATLNTIEWDIESFIRYVLCHLHFRNKYYALISTRLLIK